jgi:hypothetical protein
VAGSGEKFGALLFAAANTPGAVNPANRVPAINLALMQFPDIASPSSR